MARSRPLRSSLSAATPLPPGCGPRSDPRTTWCNHRGHRPLDAGATIRSGPMSTLVSEATYRAATPADLEAEHAAFCSAEGGVLQAHGYPWSDPPFTWFAEVHRHLLAHDPGRCFVAEIAG